MRFSTPISGERRQAPAWRRRYRPWLEEFEDRTLLSSFDFAGLANQLAPEQIALQTAIADAASIPFLGQQIARADPNGPADLISDHVGTIITAFRNLGTADSSQVQQALSGTGVVVKSTVDNGTSLTLELTAQQTATSVLNFNLGLGEFLHVKSTGGVYFTETLGFDFKFTYTPGAANPLSIDTGATALSLTVAAQLTDPNNSAHHSQFDATLNDLMHATVTDNGTSRLSGTLQVGLGSSPPAVTFSGEANADLHLALGFAPNLNIPLDPQLSADLHLDWSMTDADLTVQDYTRIGQITDLSFHNVALDVGAALPSFLEPIVSAVQEFTRPLQPLVNFLTTEVPILNDFGVHKTFFDLLAAAAGFPDPNSLSNALYAIKFIDQIPTGQGAGSTDLLNLGNFSLTGSEITNVLEHVNTPYSASDLQTLADIVSSSVPSATDALNAVVSDLGAHSSLSQFIADAGSGADGVHFPLFEDPTHGAFQLLMGRDVDLFTFQLPHFDFPMQASVGFSVLGVFGLGLDAGLDLAIDLKAGYDTNGLRQATQDYLADAGTDQLVRDVLHGFYVDDSQSTITNPLTGDQVNHYATGLDLFGSFGAHVSLGVTFSAGIEANVSAHLNPNLAGSDGRVRLDQLLDSLANDLGRTFALSGKVSAFANLDFSVGAGPFKVTLFHYDLAQYDLVNFDTAGSDSPDQENYPREIPIHVGNDSGIIRVIPYTHIDLAVDKTLTRESGIEVLYPDGETKRYLTKIRSGIELYQGYGVGDGSVTLSNPAYYIVTDFGGSTAPGGDHTVIVDPQQAPDVDVDSSVPTALLSAEERSRLLQAANNTEDVSWAGVNGLLVGGPGNDDLEWKNPAGDAIVIGGGGTDVLVGGVAEYGGFPSSSTTLSQLIDSIDPGSSSLVNPTILNQLQATFTGNPQGDDRLVAPDGKDATLVGVPSGYNYLQTGTGTLDHPRATYRLTGGSGDNWFDVQAGNSFITNNVTINTPAPAQNTLHVRDADDPYVVPIFGGPPAQVQHAIGVRAGASWASVFENEIVRGRSYRILNVNTDLNIDAVAIDANAAVEMIELADDILTSHIKGISLACNGGRNTVEIQGSPQLFDSYTLAPDGVAQEVQLLDDVPTSSEFPLLEQVVIRGLKSGDQLVIDGGGGPNGGGDDYDFTWDSQNTLFTTTIDEPYDRIDALTIHAQGVTGDFDTGLSVTDNSVQYVTNVVDDQGDRQTLRTTLNYYNQAAQLTIYASQSSDTVTVNRGNARGDTTIYGSNSGTDFAVTNGARNIKLYGGSGDDTFTVNGFGNYFLDGGGGNDSYAVNVPLYIKYNQFHTHTTIQDSGPTLDDSVTVNVPQPYGPSITTGCWVQNGSVLLAYDRSMFFFGGREVDVDTADSQVAYSGIAAVTVNLPRADPHDLDSVGAVVESTNVTTTINAAGPQTDMVIARTARNLDVIQGAVTINGAGATNLYVFDQNNPFQYPMSDQYTIGPDYVQRPNVNPNAVSPTTERVAYPISFTDITRLAVYPGTRQAHTTSINSPEATFTYVSDSAADTVNVDGLMGQLEVAGNTSAGQLNLGGPLQLSYQTLSAIKGSNAVVGDQIVIVDDDSAVPAGGTFANLPEGSTFQSGIRGQITYAAAGDRSQRDVQLTYLNTPPVITAINVPSTTHEQGYVGGTVVVSDPDLQDGHWYTFDWGDGHVDHYGARVGLLIPRLQHVYTEENSTPFTLTVTVSDGHLGGTATATLPITVYDAPLTLHSVVPNLIEKTSFNGVVATFTDPGTDGTINDYRAGIDWGDGSARTTATIVPAGNRVFNIIGSHTYAEDGGFPLTVQLEDTGGAAVTGPYSWQAGANLPAARMGSVAVRGTDGLIYVIGGVDAGGLANTLWQLNPVTNNWTGLGALPEPLYGIAAAAGADGGIYVFGGRLRGGQASTHAYRYDPASFTWTAIADMPQGTSYAAAATDRNGLLYVLGGEHYDAAGNLAYLATVQVYDPGAGTWSTRVPMPTPRSHLAAVLGRDGLIYALGGTNADQASLSAAETFDPVLTDWTSLPGMTTTRADLAAAVGPDGLIYAIGGDGVAPAIYPGVAYARSDTEAFNPKPRSWTRMADLAQGRAAATAVSMPDLSPDPLGGYRILVLGGVSQGNLLAATEILSHSPTRVADAPLAVQVLPVSATEDAAFSGPVATFTDPAGDGTTSEYQATISWGDNSSTAGTITSTGAQSFTVSGSKTYAAKGPYTLQVTITDSSGNQVTASKTITVADAPLSVQAASVSATTGQATPAQTVATFTDPDPTAQAADYFASAVWSDGEKTAASVVADGNGGFNVVASKTNPYTTPGNQSVSVTITDADGAAWSGTPALPNVLAGAAAATAANGRIYVFGGATNMSGQRRIFPRSVPFVFAYDPATATWTTLRSMPQPTAYAAAVTGPDGKIYVLGGYQYRYNTSGATQPPLSLNTMQIYDPVHESWSFGPALPIARYGLATALGADGLIYAFGGRSGSAYPNVVEVYNPVTRTWSTKAGKMPVPRVYLAATTGPDGRIYVLGGTNPNLTGSSNDVDQVYDPSRDTWATLPSLGPARFGLAAVSFVDGRIYALGGAPVGTNTALTSVEAFDPLANAWSQMPAMASARQYLAAVVGPDNALYAMGGTSGGTVFQSSFLSSAEVLPFLAVPARASVTSTVTVVAAPAPTTTTLTSSVYPSGIVSAYQADGNANDAIGTNNGTIQGNVTFVPGRFGQAFNFDGANGAVTIPASSSLDVGSGTGLTVTAWIDPADLQTAGPIVEWTNGLHLWATTNFGAAAGPGNLYANLRSGATDHIISSAANVLQTGQWQFVALTYDQAAGIATLYVNDTNVAQENLGSFTPGTNTDLNLGNRPANSFSGYTVFDGAIDQVGIYNRALTSDEINTVFTSSGNPSQFGQAVVVTATVSAAQTIPTGSVAFAVDGAAQQPVALTNGEAAITLTNLVGRHTIAAVYTPADNSFAASEGSWTQTALPAGAIAFYPADGNATDLIGGNNGTLENGTAFAPAFTGQDGDQAFQLDGTSQYVALTGSANVQGPRTVAAWVDFAPPQGSGLPILTAGTGPKATDFFGISGPTAPGTYNGVTPAADYLYIDHWGTASYESTRALTPNTWNYVAYTYDGNTVTFYINGAAAGSLSGSLYDDIIGTFSLGGNTQGGTTTQASFDGSIDDLAIYDRALSATEIQTYYKEAVPTVSQPLADITPVQTFSATANLDTGPVPVATFADADGSVADHSATINWGDGTTDKPDTISGTIQLVSSSANGAVFQVLGDHTYSSQGSYSVEVIVNNNSGQTVTSGNTTFQVTPPLPSGVVAFYKAEDNAVDVVGGNNGSVQGNLSYAPGRFGQAFSFDGVNAAVDVSAAASLDVAAGSGFTLTAWIKPSSVSAEQPLIEWLDGLHLWISVTYGGAVGPGNLYASLPDGNGNPNIISSSPGLIVAGQWQFVALTYDRAGGLARLYINGQKVAEMNLGNITANTTEMLTLGKRIPSGLGTIPYAYTGLMDEVGIYNRALTATEIGNLFTLDGAGS